MNVEVAREVGSLVSQAMKALGVRPSSLGSDSGLGCKAVRQIMDGVPNQTRKRIEILVRELPLSKRGRNEILGLLATPPPPPSQGPVRRLPYRQYGRWRHAMN